MKTAGAELHASSRHYSAPWRKARICARLILHPNLTDRQRYAKLAATLIDDPSVTNRLIGQAISHLKGKKHQRGIKA